MALLSMRCPNCAGEEMIFLVEEVPLKQKSLGVCPYCAEWVLYRTEGIGKRARLYPMPEIVFRNSPSVNHVTRLVYNMLKKRDYLRRPGIEYRTFPQALMCPWCGEMQFGAETDMTESPGRGIAFTCIDCDGPAVVENKQARRAEPQEYGALIQNRWYIDSMYALFIARDAYRSLDKLHNRKGV